LSEETKDKLTSGPLEYAEEMRANGKLFAACPDLLAALILCVEDYEDDMQETEAWQMLHVGKVDLPPTPSHIMHARAAIDKARNGA